MNQHETDPYANSENGTSQQVLSPSAEELLRRLQAGEFVPAPRPTDHPAEPGDATEPDLDRVLPPSRIRTALIDRLPVGVRGALLDPALRGALSLGLVALVAALAALGVAWRSAPRPVAVPAAPAVTAAAGTAALPAGSSGSGGTAATSTAAPSAAQPAATLMVDVAGKVRRPGVVSLPAGARVDDALNQAGGVLPGTDTSALSLARKVVDGEQILVTGKPGTAAPVAGAAPAGPSSAGSGTEAGGGGGAATSGGAPGGPLDLNTATVDQLDALPGVGPVLAGRILEWRTAHNGFTSVDQLREVKGLGGKTGNELLPLVRVG